jgi:hypothetical protein
MPGRSRSMNGVASLAYVPGIHVLRENELKRRGWPVKRGHDALPRHFRTQITRMTDWSIGVWLLAGAMLWACRKARRVSAGISVA